MDSKAQLFLSTKVLPVPERVLPTGTVIRPRSWIENETLFYEFEGSQMGASSYERVLSDFINLSEASAKVIAEFAGKYGPLALCKAHQMPMFSSLHPDRTPESATCPPCSRSVEANDPPRRRIEAYEPLTAWRAWARRAEATLILADALHAKAEDNETHWQALGFPKPRDFDERRIFLAFEANAWLEYARPVPTVSLVALGRLEMRFIPYKYAHPASEDQREWWSNLLSGYPQHSSFAIWQALGLQLAAAICGAGMVGVAICSACGSFFTVKRAPAVGRRRFCKRCGKRASWRLSKRDQRPGTR